MSLMTRTLRSVGLLVACALPGCSLDFDAFEGSTQESDVQYIDAAGHDDASVTFDVGGPARDAGPGGRDTGGPGTDGDGDGVADDVDNCPHAANADQADQDDDALGDACDPDVDGDGVDEVNDNCPGLANPGQYDLDRDMLGDACDPDPDGDGLDAAGEAALGTDPLRRDTDGDGVADGADPCPLDADRVGRDTDQDGAGDACDPDDDGDLVPDWRDNCPGTPNVDQLDADGNGRGDACADDADGDGVTDDVDNCAQVANPDQAVAPCQSRFDTMTFVRAVHAVALGAGNRAVAGTSGGALVIDGDTVTRLSNADGLADNRLRAVEVDAAGRAWFVADGGLSVVRADGFIFNLRPGDQGGGPMGTLRDVAVAGDDLIYVSSDAGLNTLTEAGWSLSGVGELPSVDLRGMYLTEEGVLWIATDSSVLTLGTGRPVAAVAGLPADLGGFLDVAPAPDGGVWLLAEQGAVRLAPDGTFDPGQVFRGFEARALVGAPRASAYLATEAGVRRIDGDGRLFPPGSALLPTADVRALAGAPDGPRWVGTGRGLVQIDGYFAAFPATDALPRCVRGVVRIEGRLWIGTHDGLVFHLPDGSTETAPAAALPAPAVNVIRRLGDEVWVGTDAGIAVFGIDGTPLSQITAQLPAASVTDIVAGAPGEVWVATAGAGVARRNAGGDWQIFTQQGVPPEQTNFFLSNEARALAFDGDILWIATPLGLTRFQQSQGAFVQPVTTQNGRLPNPQVNDVVVGDGRVFAATAAGIAVQGVDNQWGTLRRNFGGVPAETGTDTVLAVAYDGTWLWAFMDASPGKPDGSLVRRRADLPAPAREPDQPVVDPALLTLFDSQRAGLLPTEGADGVALDYADGELFVSYCGDIERPGGLVALDGVGAVTRDLSGLGLPGPDLRATLTRDYAGNPMYVVPDGEGAQALRLLPEGPTALELRGIVDGRLDRCDAPEGGGDLWCLLQGVGVAHRSPDGEWSVLTRDRISALGDGTLDDIEVQADNVVWVAGPNGVLLLDPTNVRTLNNARSGGGLPSDAVRDVELGPDGRLYAGTDAGVGIYEPDSRMWETLDATVLPNVDVTAIAVSPNGTLWIGTADGLFRWQDAAITAFDTGAGLPVTRITALAAHADGRVFVGTPAGLAVLQPGDTFAALGFVDGLPGVAVHDIVVSGDGAVWVLSDDGVGRLRDE
mgnify:CR=1 FL=1